LADRLIATLPSAPSAKPDLRPRVGQTDARGARSPRGPALRPSRAGPRPRPSR
jgi:hypothetical protein